MSFLCILWINFINFEALSYHFAQNLHYLFQLGRGYQSELKIFILWKI